jgi:S1-C subfamily serine protease
MKFTIMVTALFLAAVSVYGQKPKPTLKETLDWIQDSLNDGYGDVDMQTANGTEIRAPRLADFAGCRVHFVYDETVSGKETFHAEYSFDLGVIDPVKVRFFSRGITSNDPGLFTAVTQNAIKKMAFKNGGTWSQSASFIVGFYSPYGDDFAEAFKHAVKMCGGKPSIFPESNSDDRHGRASIVAGGVATQSAPPRKDIPAIAKAANGAIVTVITAFNDRPIALGTGFLVSPDGVILTNYHVIETGNIAVVKFPGGTVLPVDGVLAADKVRDLAIIKIHGKTFRTLTLGNSDQIRVGEEVVAIGNPLSLESTVSNGIVSGMRTSKEQGGKFLQTTAPISPGSSGGPLFNMAGEVVGITTLKFKGGENLNFAIPINDAKRLLLAKSSRIQPLPNEPEPVQAKRQDGDAPPSASTSAPDLKTTVEFMGRMVEPEHRDILLGELKGAELPTACWPGLTIVSYDMMWSVFRTGASEEPGYTEFTYSIVGDDGKYTQKDYPRYLSFCLGDIDPSSIKSFESGYDMKAVSEFWGKHPECESGIGSVRCMNEYFKTGLKVTVVAFHTTDLKPLIERGGFEGQQQTCSDNEKVASGGVCGLKPMRTETVPGAMVFFRDKNRAERFVTALTYAVKIEGGKPDLFPPSLDSTVRP